MKKGEKKIERKNDKTAVVTQWLYDCDKKRKCRMEDGTGWKKKGELIKYH